MMNKNQTIVSTSMPFEAIFCKDDINYLLPDSSAEAAYLLIEAWVIRDGDHEEYHDEDNDGDDSPFEKKPRSLDEMQEVIKTLRKQIWYNRNYMNLRELIEEGEVKIVGDAEWHAIKFPENQNYIVEEKWASAQRTAQKIEEQLGAELLVIVDHVDLATLEGKLSALQYACGEEWEHLYA